MSVQLTSITLGSFKGIKTKARLPLAPVTLLFGANSTGKSTILHGLLYLYEVLINKNLDPEYSEITGRKIWLGGFKNLVHGKDTDGVITLGVGVSISDPYFDINSFLYGDEDEVLAEAFDYSGELYTGSWQLTVEIAWDSFKERPFIQTVETFSEGELVSRIQRKSGTPAPVLTHLAFLEPWLDEMVPVNGSAVSDAIALSGMEVPGKSALPDFSKRLQFSNPPWDWGTVVDVVDYAHAQTCLEASASMAIYGPAQATCDLLKNLLHIGPIRVIPDDSFALERDYRPQRWVDGSGGWDTFASGSEDFQQTVNECFYSADLFGANYAFCVSRQDIAGRRTVYLEHLLQMVGSHRLTEVGVGISQVFPVIAALNLERDTIVSCEQPELHIHPRWQLALADIMLKSIKGKHQKLLIMETHSEHLMLRLLRRRRETVEESLENELFSCAKGEVQVIFCECATDAGTRLTPISITDEGEFDAPWPNGFFGERRKELF